MSLRILRARALRISLLHLAALLGVCMLSGCLTVDQELSLRETGGGTFHVSYSITQRAIDQIRTMLRLRESLASASGIPEDGMTEEELHFLLDPNEERIRNELKKYEANGITIDRLVVDNRPDSHHVRIELSFDDLQKASQADFFSEYGFSLYRNQQGNYVLFRAGHREDVEESSMNFADPAVSRMLSPLLGGFRYVMAITAPRNILDTNAPRQSQFTATWTYDFDRDPNALVALQSDDLKVVFDGEGVRLPRIRHPYTEEVLKQHFGTGETAAE